MTQYDNDFPTCLETYATLRVFSASVSATQITEYLALTPSRSFEKGDAYGAGRLRANSAWMLSSQFAVTSKDTRRHIDWLLVQLAGKADAIDDLRDRGCELDICCIWVSVGQGGPVISPPQMTALVELGLDVWWDVYFDTSEQGKSS